MRKRIYNILLILILICSFNIISSGSYTCSAQSEMNRYTIYDYNENFLTTSQECVVGDMFITEDNILYEVVEVNIEQYIAYAIVRQRIKLPAIKNSYMLLAENLGIDKEICLYFSHNDESYVPTDGYDSVYGRGGIMDIGDLLGEKLEAKGINVDISENMHLPHDYYAYSRSEPTAKSLLATYSPDAIFDIHRDGVSESQYETTVNGLTASKVRIVIGKANSNYADNLDFAIAIKAYADEKFPNLIKDIYMGSGHYNQNLSPNSLLFEMGTYLIEKEKVAVSTEFLASTIDKVMYTSVVESPSGDDSFGEGLISDTTTPDTTSPDTTLPDTTTPDDSEISIIDKNAENLDDTTTSDAAITTGKKDTLSAFVVVLMAGLIYVLILVLSRNRSKKL